MFAAGELSKPRALSVHSNTRNLLAWEETGLFSGLLHRKAVLSFSQGLNAEKFASPFFFSFLLKLTHRAAGDLQKR